MNTVKLLYCKINKALMRILVYRPDFPSGVRIWATLSVVPFTDNPKLLSVVTSYRVFDLLTHMFSIFFHFVVLVHHLPSV